MNRPRSVEDGLGHRGSLDCAEGLRYLIVAGTEKAGTTSVYHYLNSHPDVVGSIRKETDFFRTTSPHALADYHAHFPLAEPGATLMEASPGYLSESKCVAPAIAHLLPEARLLFILREPLERLLSGFLFHKSRFHIPESLGFDEYIDLCLSFERGDISEEDAGLKAWHLSVVSAGRYAHNLRNFYECFPREQIKVMTTHRLQKDSRGFMRDVCSWAELNPDVYERFSFVRSNAGFQPKRAWMQRAGLRLNRGLEPLFNRHPKIKLLMLNAYKRLNGREDPKPTVSPRTTAALVEYYASDLADLQQMVGTELAEVEHWLRKYDV